MPILSDLVVRITGQTKDFERSAKKVERSTKSMEADFKKLGKRLALVGAASATAGVLITKKLLEVGVTVEETASKFQTVFGPATEEVSGFIKEFAVSAGLANSEAQELTATVGAIAQGIGFTQRGAADLSEQVVRLSADIASFNNTQGGAERVVRSLISAMNGETESLKEAANVAIVQSDVMERASEMTGKATSQITRQERALATVALVTERAGVAVGDLARTQASLANQQRAVGAETRNIVEQLGDAAREALEASGALDTLRQAVEDLGDSVEKNKPEFQAFMEWLFNLGGSVTGFAAEGINELVDALVFAEGLTLFGSDRADEIRALHEYRRQIEEFGESVSGLGPLPQETKDLLSGTLFEGIDPFSAPDAEPFSLIIDNAGGAAKKVRDLAKELEAAMSAGDALADAADAGLISIGDAVRGLAVAEEALSRVARDTAFAIADRVQARERELEIAEQLARLRGQQAFLDRASSGTIPRRDIDPRAGIPGAGQITTFDVELLNLFPGGTERRLQLMIAKFREMSEGSRSLAASIDPVLRGIAAVADAFGLLSERGQKALRGVSDLIGGISTLGPVLEQVAEGKEALEGGADIEDLEFPDLASIASAIAGFGSIVSGVAGVIQGLTGGESPAEAAARRTREENTKALERLREGIARLGDELFGERGADIAGLRDLLSGLEFEGLGGFISDALELRSGLADLGLTFEDAARIAESFGIELDRSTDAWLKFRDALQTDFLRQITEDFGTRFGLLQQRFELLDIDDPLAQIDDVLGLLADQLPTKFFAQLDGAIAGDNLDEFIGNFFDRLLAGDPKIFDLLGDLSLDQFLDALGFLESNLDSLSEEVSKTTDAFRNVPRIFKTQLRIFQASDPDAFRDPVTGQLSGGGSVNIDTININGSQDPRRMVDQLEREIERRKRQGGARLFQSNFTRAGVE